MKRHPALVPLSHDHHHALVVAQQLQRASAATAADAAAAFLAFWESDAQRHFRIEEEVVLPAYAAHGEPEHPAVVATLLDHVVIRRDAKRLRAGAPVELLHALGERLAGHVRLEERRLFPLLEAALPEDALTALGAEIRAAEADA